MKTQDIHIRDPFILTENGMYYMHGTTPSDVALPGGGPGFAAYRSRDLQEWEGPFPAFVRPGDYWADRDYWAPEVHKRHGRYYMLASFKAPGRCRATQILASDSPLGPFSVHSPEPVTPPDWECLDGTLHVDENGRPFMVFCHEWLQVGDGEMCCVRLSEDLTRAEGEPELLFRASEAAWARPIAYSGDAPFKEGLVTDGPYLFNGTDGRLRMLWSSYGEEGYAMGVAVSRGGVMGPWEQAEKPLFSKDGGHGMVFESLSGERLLSLHVPNKNPLERPVFLPLPHASL